MATVSLLQQRVNLAEGYQVINTVTAATGIPMQVFMYRQTDDMFSHVADIRDLAYPLVNTVDVDYYRQASATRNFDDVVTALEFANLVKKRITDLLALYTPTAAAFPGSEVTVLPV